MADTPILNETFGRDGNKHPAIGGFSAAMNPVAAKMIPDATDPELGAIVVSVAGAGAGPGTSLDGGLVALAAADPAVSAWPTMASGAVQIRNHDGAAPNGNADNVYICKDATGDDTDHLFCLKPDEEWSIAIDDPAKVFLYSPGNVTVSVAVLA